MIFKKRQVGSHQRQVASLENELDLDILPLDLPAKIQVCMSVRSAGRVKRTDTHTHTDDVAQRNYFTILFRTLNQYIIKSYM